MLSMRSGGVVLSVCVLASCSSYAPFTNLTGVTREQVVARMGAPETQQALSDGQRRLEFPTGPYGKQTWFVTLDAAGKVVQSEQVLTESNFHQINPGMAQQVVRNLLGRPGQTQSLARGRGVVWSYRYENPFCQWYQVEIGADKAVRSAGFGQPPECDRPNEIIIPN